MTDRRLEALANARDLANDLGRFDVGMCLQEIRKLYEIGPSAPDAAGAWRRAKYKHTLASAEDLRHVPAGVPVFWLGGSSGHGHIAMHAGSKPGTTTDDVWSTDFLEAGRLDRVDASLIGPKWGMQLVGWAEDLNGVRIYEPITLNRVTAARAKIGEAIRLLEAAPKNRAVVQHAAVALRGLLETMPVR
jgi:hypothetical protein